MLRKNPLTMQGTLDRCWLFTYGAPLEEVRSLVPPELEVVEREGRAFWNVVVCRIRKMRPWPLPTVVGVTYWHVAYRTYARFHPAQGAPIEGVYFLRSDCDSRLMAAMGNLLTDYRFHTAPVCIREEEERVEMEVRSKDCPGRAVLDRAGAVRLPAHSAFSSLDEAARFLKYKPCGLSAIPGRGASVVRISRDERAWQYRLVRVEEAEWAFFQGKSVLPEICYQVDPIEYRWNRAQVYPGPSLRGGPAFLPPPGKGSPPPEANNAGALSSAEFGMRSAE
jgi:hypothetical protein